MVHLAQRRAARGRSRTAQDGESGLSTFGTDCADEGDVSVRAPGTRLRPQRQWLTRVATGPATAHPPIAVVGVVNLVLAGSGPAGAALWGRWS